jgi:hypothetical protein
MLIELDRRLFEYTKEVVMADASHLGLKPGEWPDFIAITDDDHKGFLLQKMGAEITQAGDVLYMNYADRNGHLPIVKIFND